MADNGEESKIPLTAVVGLAVALTALWLAQEPLKSSRPQIDGYVEADQQSVQARLWQDPIEAIEAPWRERKAIAGPGSLKFKDNPAKHTGVFLAVTEGSPYAENHEKRLRDRYAVLSALSVACFRPVDEEHLGYFSSEFGSQYVPIAFEWFKARHTKHCHKDKDYKDHYDQVVVLWLTEDMLGDAPISRLRKFVDQLVGTYQSQVCRDDLLESCASHVDFKIIGPPSSSMLRIMLREACGIDSPHQVLDVGPARTSVLLYSPWATAAPDILLYGVTLGLQTSSCKNLDVADVLRQSGISLEHTVESDETVAVAMIRELRRRQVRLGEDRIALIGEWDTFYGRALPIIFRAAACVVANEHQPTPREAAKNLTDPVARARREKEVAKRGDHCRSMRDAVDLQMSHPAEWDQLNMNVLRYSYLRGLDGMVPKPKRRNDMQDKAEEYGKADKGTKGVENKGDSKNIEELERADGQSQLDYLRRLVARMKDDHDAAQAAPLKAIGILGSDVYDTLLILRAVREEFPDALFFTTNLDARFLHEAEKKWTRNLIVVSPFGFQLQNEIQRDIPPFRDSYQTSAFFAVLKALGHIRGAGHVNDQQGTPLECKESRLRPSPELPSFTSSRHEPEYEVDLTATSFASRICPRIFEIGRNGPVNLSAADRRRDEPQSIHPVSAMPQDGMGNGWNVWGSSDQRKVRAKILWLVVATLLMVSVFTKTVSRTWKRIKRAATHGHTRLFGRADRGWNAFSRLGILGLLSIALVAGLITIATMWFGLASLEWIVGRDGWEGEPLNVFDGVSTWPAIVIRILVIAWTIPCLVTGWYSLCCTNQELTYPSSARRSSFSASVRDEIVGFIQSIRWIHAIPRADGRPRSLQDIWTDYQAAGSIGYRLGRALILLVIYMFFLMIIKSFTSTDFLFVPCRGATNCMMNHVVMMGTVLTMVFLNMFVFDAVMLCQSFIGQLRAGPLLWPEPVLTQYGAQRQMAPHYLSEYLTVRLIGDRTHAIHTLVFCPFIALFLMVLSRNRYFDNWDFPIWLIVVWMVYAVIALTSLIVLRVTAGEAREEAVAALRQKLVAAAGKGEGGRAEAEQIRMTIEDVKNFRQGAYAPLLRHPAFSAALLAALSFLQYWLLGQY